MNVEKYFPNLMVYFYLNILSRWTSAQVFITAFLYRIDLYICIDIEWLSILNIMFGKTLHNGTLEVGRVFRSLSWPLSGLYQVITKVTECFCYSMHSTFHQLSISSIQILNKWCSYSFLEKNLCAAYVESHCFLFTLLFFWWDLSKTFQINLGDLLF